jgi:carotenoid cleavage dioxygenase
MDAGADLPVSRANIAITAPDGTPPPDAPGWIWSHDNPYLHGTLAPTAREYEADALEVASLPPRWRCAGACIRCIAGRSTCEPARCARA